MSEVTTLARPYAKAVLDLAQQSGAALSNWQQRLDLLAALVSYPPIRTAIENPRQTAEQSRQLIISALGPELGPEGINLVSLLIENHRLSLAPQIAELYGALRTEAEGSVDAEVVTATGLDTNQQQRIVEALSRRLGRRVNLTTRIDESLVGGAVIRAGDLVIDGSVRSQLERLSRALVH
ncbi:MAG: F0F1 ATP synthase subunit delta [Pseudomonadota bacterium]|jgi:F-type H+-transporting ATPase subunit delta